MSKGWLIARDAWPTLLAHTPSGWAWSGFRIPGKTAYRFWKALANSLTDAWTALAEMESEVDYRTGTQFIGEWETALSLPDPCLPQVATIEGRRGQIELRLSKTRWTTEQDWKDLAALFGLTLRITPGWLVQKQALYEWCYPKYYYDFPKLGRFRVYVDIYEGCGEEGYIYNYPATYGFADECETFKCLIERVKPANVIIIWNNWPTTECSGNGVTFSDEFTETFS